jgi:hypothetical protein
MLGRMLDRGEKMRWQVKTFPIFTWLLVTGALALTNGWGIGAALMFATFFIVPYLVWARYSHNIQMRRLLRGPQLSDKTLALQSDIISLALGQNLIVLWLIEIGSLAFVAIGIFMLFVDPGKRLIAVVSIGFFGICAAFAMYMLVLRRRATMIRS